MRPKPPSRLYKYEAFTVQTLWNLKSQCIFFGSPRRFNDTYDCAISPRIIPPTDDELEVIRKYLLQKPDAPERIKHLTLDALRGDVISATATAIKGATAEFLDRRGVTCFSETQCNLLMWAHYADKSQGICLEFDTAYHPFEKVEKVTYEAGFPSISVSEALFPDGEDSTGLINKLFCTKSDIWAYEREWRGIHIEKDIKFCYLPECLTGIYFGPDVRRETIEIVCLVILGQNENVRFYKGRRTENEFKVEFEPFTYASNLEAKRRGLKT